MARVVRLRGSEDAANLIVLWETSMLTQLLQIARACYIMHNSSLEKRRRVRQLTGYGRKKWQKLVAIGGNLHLRSDGIKQFLPLSYTLLYELSSLHAVQIATGIETGVIHRGASRASISAWRKSLR